MKIGCFSLDGYNPIKRTAYEFNSCFYHGCDTCFKPRSFNSVCRKTFQQLQNETEQRAKYIDQMCQNPIIMKECTFLNQLKEKKTNLKNELEKRSQLTTTFEIDMHDALYGEQTSPVCLFKDVFQKKGAKIFYIDFNSFYSFVQHKYAFPIHHPKSMTDKKGLFPKINNTHKTASSDKDGMGFAKCTVLPPKQLFIPTLPVKINRKLLFPLCTQCAKEKQTKNYKHDEQQRSINVTWCISKLRQAVKDGYKIKNVSQLLIYNQKENVFADFTAKFYILKQKYSGIPENIENKDNLTEELVNYTLNVFGLKIDPSKIHFERNNGMRVVMKLILNSL